MADEGRPATPRWVKWGRAALAVLLLIAAGMMLSGQGHGPARHLGQGVAAPAGEDAP